MTKEQQTIIHIEADAGSSILDIHIENADAAQLFAAAEILRVNGNMALAGQMAHAQAQMNGGKPRIEPAASFPPFKGN